MIGSQSGSTSFARLNHCMIDCGGASEVSPIMRSFRSPNLIGIVGRCAYLPIVGENLATQSSRSFESLPETGGSFSLEGVSE